MKVFRGKQRFNTQFAHMCSVFCPHSHSFSRSWSWSPSFADTSLIEQELSSHDSIQEYHPCRLNFHWAKRLHSRKFECRYLSKWLWFDFRRKLHKLFFQFQFEKTATVLTKLLQGINNMNSNFVRSALTDFNGHCWKLPLLWNLQSSFAEPPSLCKL